MVPKLDSNGEPVMEKDGSPIMVPQKGIIILDDFNRADIRILKGTMQLIQDYKTLSWALPEGWTIFLTANPSESEDQYAVAELDGAMVTRMRHCQLEADKFEWAKWAEVEGIDKRGNDNFLTSSNYYPWTVGVLRCTELVQVEKLRTIL